MYYFGKGSKKVKMEVYVLTLLKFSDDRVVYSQEELESMEKAIYVDSGIFKEINKDKIYHFEYEIIKSKTEEFEKILKKVSDDISNMNIEFYYYHHRVIIKYSFEMSVTNSKLREIREKINEYSCNLINSHVVNKVNHLVKNGDVSKEGEIIMYYTYMMFLIPQRKYLFNKMADKLSSLSFKIIESTAMYGREHYIRISLPNITVYYKKKLGIDIKLGLIHSIYQYCLYNKKLDGIEAISKHGIKAFNKEFLNTHNELDDKQLTQLWAHITDNLGGKLSDSQMRKISKSFFYLTIITVILAIASLISSIVSIMK